MGSGTSVRTTCGGADVAVRASTRPILRTSARALPLVRSPRTATAEGDLMAGYRVAHLDEIDEHVDGRCHYRPVRHHFGITSFGATVWTGHTAGDLVIDEHDEG